MLDGDGEDCDQRRRAADARFYSSCASARERRCQPLVSGRIHPMTPMLHISLHYALVPVLFPVVGAAMGAFVPAMARLRNDVLQLAAGAVAAGVSAELLMKIVRRALVGIGVIGFALGIATMLAADSVIDRNSR